MNNVFNTVTSTVTKGATPMKALTLASAKAANKVNKINKIEVDDLRTIHFEETTVEKNYEFMIQSTVPSIFVSIMRREEFFVFNIVERQIMALAVFATIYNCKEADELHHLEAEYFEYLDYFIKKNRDKFNWKETEIASQPVREYLATCGFLQEDEDYGFIPSTKFKSLIMKGMKFSPLTSSDPADRRVHYFKKNLVAASILAVEACDYLQSSEYSTNEHMMNVVLATKKLTYKHELWLSAFATLKGAQSLHPSSSYYSEYDMDDRGRMYFRATYGVNPQGDDMNRALYSSQNVSIVHAGSYAHKKLLVELADCVSDDKYLDERYIRNVAIKPSQALAQYLNEGDDCKVKSPFMYVRLCIDIAQIIVKGSVDCRISIGDDAKSSGTQIYAILFHELGLLQACGFSSTRIPDPYHLTVEKLDHRILREDIKKAYMAIMYSGGRPAVKGCKVLMSKLLSLHPDLDDDQRADLVINAVKKVLGAKITNFQQAFAEHIEEMCLSNDVTHIIYTHIDGTVVDHASYRMEEITRDYTEIRYDAQKILEFGSKIDNTGITIKTNEYDVERFATSFLVNFIQGLDALIARTVAVEAKKAGIKGFVSIHDCFRCDAASVHLLQGCIKRAYKTIFIDNNPLKHLCDQVGFDYDKLNIVENVFNESMLEIEGAYFFE
jgi:hypothetical protein